MDFGFARLWRGARMWVARLALPALLLTGFGLRMALLNAFPLREDEALYGYWALHGWRVDPFYLTVWPDKPPLFLWVLGGSLRLLGDSAAAARVVDVACSVLLIAVVYATARRAWGRTAALAAATLITLSPYAISFAPTVYTDPLLVLAGSLALCCALDGRPLWAGVWLAAAIMTKQQGVIYVPLVVGALLLGAQNQFTTKTQRHERRIGVCVAWLLLGMAVVILPIVYWDSLRWQVAPSPWDLSARNYAPLTLLPPGEWLGRVAAWREPAWYLLASWLTWCALVVLAILDFGFWILDSVTLGRAGDSTRGRVGRYGNRPYACRPGTNTHVGWLRSKIQNPKSKIQNGLFWLLAAWVVFFALAHVVVSVQPWDRYLLPLAPALALLGGKLWADVAPRVSLPTRTGMAATSLLVLAGPALAAATGGLPIGGDHGDYAGLEQTAARVAALDGRSVLYHQDLGWQFQFYLYDQIASGQVELRWFPSTVYLADNAAKTPYPRTFLATTEWATPPDLAAHLAMRGLALEDQGKAGHFHLWEIVHAPQPPCIWCVCKATVVDFQFSILDFGASAADSTPIEPKFAAKSNRADCHSERGEESCFSVPESTVIPHTQERGISRRGVTAAILRTAAR